ncbi:MAG: Phosphate-import protein PhnD precursor [bacterium ADurb.Bin374]|nr:MAG: Phosphate-import protein PhnD precursor [bacterium ADurb.Bin374]
MTNGLMHRFGRLAASVAFGLMLALATGCGEGDSTNGLRLEVDERLPVQFGVFPFLERGELEKALAPLTGYLAAKLGRDVRIQLVADYADLERLVRQRRIDIGWFSPRSRQVGAQGVMIPVCRPRTRSGSYQGLIVARRASGVTDLAGLASGSFAYVDRGSKSGFLYPNRVFVERGIDPLRFFRSISWAGNHETCVRGVLDGRWDAAAVTSLVMKNSPASVTGSLVVLATTAAILTDPIVIRDGSPGLGRETVRSLFSGMASDTEGAHVIASLAVSFGIFGFDAMTEADR